MTNIDDILKEFEEEFGEALSARDNLWALHTGAPFKGMAIKQFLKSKLTQQQEEFKRAVPEKKCCLTSVLISRQDELFDEHGMDGIKGFNRCIDQLNNNLK